MSLAAASNVVRTRLPERVDPYLGEVIRACAEMGHPVMRYVELGILVIVVVVIAVAYAVSRFVPSN